MLPLLWFPKFQVTHSFSLHLIIYVGCGWKEFVSSCYADTDVTMSTWFR